MTAESISCSQPERDQGSGGGNACLSHISIDFGQGKVSLVRKSEPALVNIIPVLNVSAYWQPCDLMALSGAKGGSLEHGLNYFMGVCNEMSTQVAWKWCLWCWAALWWYRFSRINRSWPMRAESTVLEG